MEGITNTQEWPQRVQTYGKNALALRSFCGK